ncbi:MAG: branched-chain amino acid ABC transporter substrate-binding protein [Alphaproteobacteria bacterium]
MSLKSGTKWILGAAVASTVALASTAAFAVKVGPVEDPVRVTKIPKGAPIQIGTFLVLSGADVAQGLDGLRGIQVAVEDMGGKLMGHPIRLISEDDTCSAEGGQIAATKIAANQQVVAALGGSCSSATIPAAPILWKAGIPDITPGAASPYLTDPKKRGPGFEGFARMFYNAGWQGVELAKWAKEVKKYDNVAAIHDGSPYVEGLARAFVESFQKIGGKVCAVEAIAPTDTDMRPMLTKLSTCKPQMVFFPGFINATAYVIRQSKEVPGLEKTEFIGSDNVLAKEFMEAAGANTNGFTFVSSAEQEADFQTKSVPAYAKMREHYKKMFGENPIQGTHHFAYDSFLMVAKAIEKVAVKDNDGNLYIPATKLRDAILGTKGMKGMTGEVNCDQNGDCGPFTIALYQYVSADPNTFDLGKNPKRVYTGKK